RVQHDSRDRLPESERAVRVGNLGLARAEDHPERVEVAELRAREVGEEVPMKQTAFFLCAASLLAAAAGLPAQSQVPEIPFDSNPAPLRSPADLHMGEAAGVATNSKGDIFLYTRTGNPTVSLGTSRAISHGGSRLFQFDRTGKFVREIGQDAYGLLEAQQVRVDPQDNGWIVDQMSTQGIKFDPNGRGLMILSRKPEALRVPALPLTPLAPGVPVVQTAAPTGGRGEAASGRGAPGGRGADAAGGGRAGAGAPGGGRGAPLPGAGAEGESFQRPTD